MRVQIEYSKGLVVSEWKCFLHECTIVIVCMCGRGYTGGQGGVCVMS